MRAMPEGTKPIRVMVVDDDPRLVMAMSDVLAAEGYETMAALNGQIAIQKLAAFSPHVMVLDMEMPKMDGFDVLRWLDGNGIRVPVIIASNNDDVDAADVGAVTKLPKPFDLDQLLEALAIALAAPIAG
jgi:two-component system KDP operon response regulator KdpE